MFAQLSHMKSEANALLFLWLKKSTKSLKQKSKAFQSILLLTWSNPLPLYMYTKQQLLCPREYSYYMGHQTPHLL